LPAPAASPPRAKHPAVKSPSWARPAASASRCPCWWR